MEQIILPIEDRAIFYHKTRPNTMLISPTRNQHLDISDIPTTEKVPLVVPGLCKLIIGTEFAQCISPFEGEVSRIDRQRYMRDREYVSGDLVVRTVTLRKGDFELSIGNIRPYNNLKVGSQVSRGDLLGMVSSYDPTYRPEMYIGSDKPFSIELGEENN